MSIHRDCSVAVDPALGRTVVAQRWLGVGEEVLRDWPTLIWDDDDAEGHAAMVRAFLAANATAQRRGAARGPFLGTPLEAPYVYLLDARRGRACFPDALPRRASRENIHEGRPVASSDSERGALGARRGQHSGTCWACSAHL